MDQQLATLSTNAETISNLQADKSQMAKPDLPLELTFRTGLLTGRGVYLIHVRNASHSIVTVEVAAMVGGIRTQPVVYKFPADREMVLQNPRLSAGDKVALASPDYRPIVLTVQ